MSAAQCAGLAYENRLRKALGALPPPWIEFYRGAERHFAHPDILAMPMQDGSILLIEAKLKLTEHSVVKALRQLNDKYIPLVEALWSGRLRLAVVGRYLEDGVSTEPLGDVVLDDLDATPRLFQWWDRALDPSLRLN